MEDQQPALPKDPLGPWGALFPTHREAVLSSVCFSGHLVSTDEASWSTPQENLTYINWLPHLFENLFCNTVFMTRLLRINY